ncbi:MAG: A/G-specific adenine glycosylase [Anaerolineales bacterium]|nr:A/G-specific adenine glycosylase [Anaerolineales bacterium]
MTEFARRILAWYERHARVLPWRVLPGQGVHPNPYAVWVSEIMLQQTRVEAVIPYFARWMERFPTIESLATASEHEVLALWEGLGYYGRARNLHRAARILLTDHGGQLPTNLAALRTLPGIGRYTAAAIASIAFGKDTATLDGNLKRVFARVFDVSLPADSPQGEAALWQLAENHLPSGRAGDYNQALMDLGATVCLPRNPRCLLCPVRELCLAHAQGLQEQRPVLKPKTEIPHKHKAAAVIVEQGKALLNRRSPDGLLGGLWEFPAAEVETSSLEAVSTSIHSVYALRVIPLSPMPAIRHTYTHFRLTETPWLCQLDGSPSASSFGWVALPDLVSYPMGKVDRQIARQLVSLLSSSRS